MFAIRLISVGCGSNNGGRIPFPAIGNLPAGCLLIILICSLLGILLVRLRIGKSLSWLQEAETETGSCQKFNLCFLHKMWFSYSLQERTLDSSNDIALAIDNWLYHNTWRPALDDHVVAKIDGHVPDSPGTWLVVEDQVAALPAGV